MSDDWTPLFTRHTTSAALEAIIDERTALAVEACLDDLGRQVQLNEAEREQCRLKLTPLVAQRTRTAIEAGWLSLQATH